MTRPLALLLDTNIWLTFYFPHRPDHESAKGLFDLAAQNLVSLYYAAHSLTDVFYLAQIEQKRLIRNELGALDQGLAAGSNELAWGCIRHMREVGAPIPITSTTLCGAFSLKNVHHDYEDDVILAAADMGKVDFLVTNDQTLLTKSTVPALAAKDMLAYLR